MADDIMDDVDDTESDEKLPDESLDETIDESSDETDASETSGDDTNESKEKSDDASESEGDDDEDPDHQDESKRTPESIAKYERARRKKAEHDLREYKRTHGGNPPPKEDDGPVLPPGGLADRFWRTAVKVDIAEIAETDPTVHQRSGLIKQIIFEEMPELQKNPNGVAIANDIAKGRTIKTTPDTEEKHPITRKTSPPEPRKPDSTKTFKRLTVEQVNRLTDAQLRIYEDQLAEHLSKSSQ